MSKPFRFFERSGALICAILALSVTYAATSHASPSRVSNPGSLNFVHLDFKTEPPRSSSLSLDTTTVVGGDVSGTWTVAESPYLIQGTITVPEGASLVIEPGVQIIFDGYYRFIVEGYISAVGTDSENIVFTALDGITRWGGLRLVNANTNSKLEYCYFTLGLATGSWPDNCGGAIYISGSIASISHCKFINNHAEKWGGAIYLWSASPEFSHNIFSLNQADDPDDTPYGHALYVGSSEGLELNHLTISGNEVDEGFALYTAMGVNLQMKNSILWDSYEFSYQEGDINYCDISDAGGDTLAALGIDNLSADPRFVDAGNLDFTLRSNSPCIDAASSSSPYSNEPEPNGGRANMGAFGNTIYAAQSLPFLSFNSDERVLEHDPIEFGLQRIFIPDTTDEDSSLDIYNVGRALLVIDSVGFDDDQFSSNLETFIDTLTGTVLIYPDSSISLRLIFNPDEIAGATATLTLYSNDTTAQVALSGTGVNPIIDVEPDSLTFDNIAVGDSSTQTIVISNIGENAGGIESLLELTRFYGTENFSILDEDNDPYPDTALAVGASITYYAVFHPQSEADFQESVEIACNAGNVIVPMTGMGSSPNLGYDPDSLEFGVIAIGDGLTLEFEVWNTGSVPLELIVFTLSDPQNFSYEAPVTIIEGGDTTNVTVTFQPLAAGTYNHTFIIDTNMPDEDQITVYLYGTGTSQTNWVIGDVNGTWYYSDSTATYYVVGDIRIPAGQALVIEPAVNVEFEGDFRIDVNGTLDAQGTDSEHIEFTTIDKVDSTWSGITLGTGSSASIMSYCELRRGSSVDSSLYGGVLRIENSAPTIEHCYFYDNNAAWGGAVAVLAWAEAEFSNCVFYNDSAGVGGAIYADWFSKSIFSDCEIYDNAAGVNGGGLYLTGAAGAVYNCNIHDNEADGKGGGIFIGDGATTEIYQNDIHHNMATYGGGLAISWFSKPFIHDEVIYGNHADENGGGIFIQESCTPVILKTLIAENESLLGQAIYSISSGSLINYCTMVGTFNTYAVETYEGYEGWLLTVLDGDQTMISNSIIGEPTWPVPSNQPNQPIFAAGAELFVTYSDVMDTNSLQIFPGTGNINEPPMFVGLGSTMEEWYQLSDNSPVLETSEDGGPIGFTGGSSELTWAVTLVVLQNPVISSSMNFVLTSTVPLTSAPYLYIEQDLEDTLEYVGVDSSYMNQISPMIYTNPIYLEEEGRPSRAYFSYTNIFGQVDGDTLDFVATNLPDGSSSLGLPGIIFADVIAAAGYGTWGIFPAANSEITAVALDLVEISKAYKIMSANVEIIGGNVQFVLDDLGIYNAENCGIAYWSEGVWNVLPSYISEDRSKIWASISDPGVYRVVWGENLRSTLLVPDDLTLYQNYPNPFNPETVIEFAMPESELATVEIFNIMGRKVATLLDSFTNAGYHTVVWNGNNELGMSAASGVYFYRLQVGEQIISKKMILLR